LGAPYLRSAERFLACHLLFLTSFKDAGDGHDIVDEVLIFREASCQDLNQPVDDQGPLTCTMEHPCEYLVLLCTELYRFFAHANPLAALF